MVVLNRAPHANNDLTTQVGRNLKVSAVSLSDEIMETNTILWRPPPPTQSTYELVVGVFFF